MLWGINQGGTYADLRIRHMQQIAELDLPGYAIGGLAVGESTEVMYDIIEALDPYMPKNKTRYLMGVGPSPGAWTSSTASCLRATRVTRSSLPGPARST